MADAIPARVYAREFLALPESKLPTELLHGEVIMSPAPELRYQELVFALAKLIEELAENGKVRLSPVDVYLDDENVVQPDVLWTTPNSSCRVVDGKYLSGPPELVVEVLSPGTARHDRGKKFTLYEKYGVREYWLADLMSDYVEVFVNGESGFIRLGLYGSDESFVSPVLGNTSVDLKKAFGKE
ncbi:MAG: Uma2 family endonuclease [Anaerolineae bacterium]|nr:Uma2 family endonuclease [Anaerolineae bacterium]